jgi:hypothetical protein
MQAEQLCAASTTPAHHLREYPSYLLGLACWGIQQTRHPEIRHYLVKRRVGIG